MLQALYAAASGMEAQQTQFNAISNDMANMDTPGYEQTQVGFENLLYSNGGISTGTTSATGAGATAAIIGRDQSQGALQQTGQPLDVAINGEGFLQVRRSDGSIGLTRNGTLQADAQGRVTDESGNPLVPPLTLPKGTDPTTVKISPGGQVTANGRTLGKIAIVTVPAPTQLLPDGDSLFSATTASGATRPATGSTLQQGALESSNVDVAAVMADMITSERSYQMSSQAVQDQDQMLQTANQLRHG